MRIALVVTPMNERNLNLAAQIGVSDIVGRFPGLGLENLLALRRRVESFGMRLTVIEGFIGLDRIVSGAAGRRRQLEHFADLLRHMGDAGVPICCYNFMPAGDWSRTTASVAERGGALVSAFDAAGFTGPTVTDPLSAAQLWENLRIMLEAIVPVAEKAHVKLAMHPDDPPLASLGGHAQIMNSFESFQRLLDLVPSPANGICFCQGCFAEMGQDIPAAIARLGPHIHYAHFRDICGRPDCFRETFHDNGQTDMFAAIRAYKSAGFAGPIRPDHVPMLAGETAAGPMAVAQPLPEKIDVDTFNGPDVAVSPGYTTLGRLYAVGYMRGLMEAAGAAEEA